MTKKIVLTALLTAAFALPAASQGNNFKVEMASAAQIQEFIKNNEKLFYIEESSCLSKTGAQKLGVYTSYEAPYMPAYLKKNNIPANVQCVAPMIYEGGFINPADIEKITIRKYIKKEGLRRLKKEIPVYEIKIEGKGFLQSRTGTIRVASLKNRANKPVECIRAGQSVAYNNFTYPSALNIPQTALAQTQENNKQKVNDIKNSIALEGSRDYADNLKTKMNSML